jgi:predicted RNase H-like HicB family nuclease
MRRRPVNPVNDSQQYRYRVRLSPLSTADGSGWLAEVPELPGCTSDGESPQEAVGNVMDAIACWIEAAEEDDRPFHNPQVRMRHNDGQ